MKTRIPFALVAALAASGALSTARAADTVKIADVVELSGDGATVGTNWKNALDMAVEEINAKGGILGHKIEMTDYDTQTNPGISRAQVQKALDDKPYVIMGPIYSGSVKVNEALAQEAGVPQLVGAEAANITAAGNPFIFRTSLSQAAALPKVAAYIADDLKAKAVDLIYVNDDYGKGGRDVLVDYFKKRGIAITNDISSEAAQVDFTADVAKMKTSSANVVFIYLHEEASARLLQEIRKQGLDRPLIGETTLLNQKVIELAGKDAEGIMGFVGLSADAPVPGFATFAEKFQKKYNYKPDHNAIKAYLGIYAVKYLTEKIGSFDSKKLADAFHGATITTKDEPGILIDTHWENNGDIDRESFLAKVVDGKQKIVMTLPPSEKW
jgi:branched-chain amino acid transport system substrate-binding protein